MKVAKETPTPEGATLSIEAVDAEGGKAMGTIAIVREGNTFKLGRESWSSR